MKLRFALLFIVLACLNPGSSFGQVTTNQIHAGLVSYWPLDQIISVTNLNSDGTTNISLQTPDVANGNNFTIVGSLSTGPGKVGNAIVFTGTQYLVSTNPTPQTNNLGTGLPIFVAGAYTVAMWVNAAPQLNHYFFTEGSTASQNPLFLLQSGSAATSTNFLDSDIRNTAGTTLVNHPHTTSVVLDSTWHHIAWCDNYGLVSIYIDGVLDSNSSAFAYYPALLNNPESENAAATFPVVASFNTTVLGGLVRAAGVSGFIGSLDDVAVWQRPLSQAEVQYVMSNSIAQPIPTSPPVFLNKFAGWTNSMGDYAVLQSGVVPPATVQWYENGVMVPNATNAALSVLNLTSPGTNYFSIVANNLYGYSTNGPAPLVVVTDSIPHLDQGCFGYWPMDAVTAGATPDVYSGNNFNLTNMSADNLVTGEFSNALSFPGGSSFGVSSVSGNALPFNATNYTISFWVNGFGNVAANSYIYENSSTASALPLFGFCCPQSTANYTTNLCVYLHTDQNNALIPNMLSSNSVLDGTWHHVVWEDQNGSAMLYVDGVLDGTPFSYNRTNANQLLRTNNTLTLNTEAVGGLVRTTAANEATVQVDDLAWWERRLSYTEILMLQTNSVPTPTVFVASGINQQPVSLTNAFAGDTVNFTVGVTGTPPFTYTWYYNTTTNYTGAVISSAANPSAASKTLTLVDAQTNNAGYYYMTVSNGAAPGSGQIGGGIVTSAVVQLVIRSTPRPTKANQVVLQLEFNAVASPTDVYPGFQSMTLGGNPAIFNNATEITLTPIGGVLADRDRAGLVVNNPPALNTAALYNSFIFQDAIGAGNGIDLLIQHLAANTQYGVNIWCFDVSSVGLRISDWTEAISGATIAYQYYFNGSLPPLADYDNTLGALLTSDGNGQLDIQGIADPANSSFAVFLNALVITANPVPQILNSTVGLDGNLRISAQSQYSGQTLIFQESPDLINWQNASDGFNAMQDGPIFSAEFPLGAQQMFYRVEYVAP